MSATAQREGAELATSDLSERDHARFLWAVTVVTGIGLWLVPAFSSYWLDETVTVWVIREDLGTAIDRAFDYQQSPFYYVIAWLTRQVLGTSEFALRVPSLAAAVLATWLLYRLALRLHDREVGRLVAFAFVASPWMALAAPDARPYAIAIAAIVGAALALVRWLDDGHAWDGVWFAVACSASIWAHYLFGVTVAALFGYAAYRIARGTGLSWGRLILAAVGVAVLIAPLVAQMLSLLDRTDQLTIPGELSVEGLLTFFLRPAAFGGALVGLLIARALGPVRLRTVRSAPGSWSLWGTWAMAAPVVLFALAIVSPLAFLSPRYASSAVPAIAALLGIAIASLGPARARRIIVAVAAVLVVIAISGTQKFDEEWRGAAAFVASQADADTPVLMRPGLIESDQPDWLDDPARRSYLLAPTAAYRFGDEVIPLPYQLDDEAEGYLESLIDGRLSEVDRFLLVMRDPQTGFAPWLDGRLRSLGFTQEDTRTFGGILVVTFTREATP